MSKLIIHEGLRVSHSPYGGFGVFTDVPIKEGAIVEQCYALILHDKTLAELPSLLQQYVYNWDNRRVTCAPLGFGMIYNHNSEPNLSIKCEYAIVEGEQKPLLTFSALRDIEPGEELFSYYGEDYFKYFNIEEI